MKTFQREIRLIYHSIKDLLIRLLPNLNRKSDYRYAFLVHPRNINDVYRKYPALKVLSPKVLEFFLKLYWPVVLSRVTGLKSLKDGREIDGIILTIPLTARQMMENRDLALKRIIQGIRLAEKYGAKLIGLGGFTSSLSKGGLDLIDRTNINITTGHAYTAYNVTENLFKLTDIMDISKTHVVVAIVGAAGSIGSTSAKLIARKGFNNLILIDLERKHHTFPELIKELEFLNPKISISTSHQIKDVEIADFIITATNSPEAVIKYRDLKNGAIIIDDAQPSDISPDILTRDDVLAIEAGIVHTPGVLNHFDFNLKDKHDNFCCMAEVMVLAAIEHNSHYVINRATLEDVDKVSELGKKLGFRIGEFQNFIESIRYDKILKIKDIIHARNKL